MSNQSDPITVPEVKRGKGKCRWGLIATLMIVMFIVGLFWPVSPPLGFIGLIPSNVYFWKNPIRGGAIVAVNRELFLPVPDQHRVPEYYSTQQTKTVPDTMKWCRPDDVRPLKVGEPRPCLVGYPTNMDYCGYWNVDFNCNGIAVSGALWKDEAIRERIIHASLNACSYLYDPETGVVIKGGPAKTSRFGMTEHSYNIHAANWRGSNCQPHLLVRVPGFGVQEISWIKPREQDKIVFFKVINESSSPLSRNHQGMAIYKVIRKEGKIMGGYIDGEYNG